MPTKVRPPVNPQRPLNGKPRVFNAEQFDAMLNGEKEPMSEDHLEQYRTELFEKGSEFLPTNREEIVGIDQVLQEIDDVIHWLTHHKEYRKYGSRLEPGIVLEGRPGTGKTLVSRYIATASNAFFVNVRDWPHNDALLSSDDIAALFKKAREKYAEIQRPIILFWDEFEANACERMDATPEQASSVSQLTAELDGIHGKNEGVLLIGCTNYAHQIDDALLRSGRMGVHIEFTSPDREGKRKLLQHYLTLTKTKGKIDVDTLSYFFDSDATAADIEEAVMEAWRYAVRRTIKDEGAKKPSLAQADLMEVFVKRLVGPPTMFCNLESEKRARVALHEVGHAVMCLVYGIPLRLITVRPGKSSLGKCICGEVEEHIGTADEILDGIRVSVGSIAAEEVAGLPAGVGTTSDIDQANAAAQRLVDTLSQGGSTGIFSPVSLGEARGAHSMEPPRPNVSERYVERADHDIEKILNQTLEEAKASMKLIGKDNLWKMTHVVNDRETMTGKEFEDLFAEVIGHNDFDEFLA